MKIAARLRATLRHQSFCSHISKGNDLKAIEVFPDLKLENGLKQTAMAQYGNVLMRLGQFGQALNVYEAAALSERDWGQRRSKNDSHCLISYCGFFAESARCKLNGSPFENWQSLATVLDCLPASKSLKRYDLAMPFR